MNKLDNLTVQWPLQTVLGCMDNITHMDLCRVELLALREREVELEGGLDVEGPLHLVLERALVCVQVVGGAGEAAALLEVARVHLEAGLLAVWAFAVILLLPG